MVPDPTKACVGLEYFCFEGDDLWTMDDDELVDARGAELEQLGLATAVEGRARLRRSACRRRIRSTTPTTPTASRTIRDWLDGDREPPAGRPQRPAPLQQLRPLDADRDARGRQPARRRRTTTSGRSTPRASTTRPTWRTSTRTARRPRRPRCKKRPPPRLRRSRARALVAGATVAAAAPRRRAASPAVWWAPLNVDEELTMPVCRTLARRHLLNRLRRPRRRAAPLLPRALRHAGPGPGLVGLRVPSLFFLVAALPAVSARRARAAGDEVAAAASVLLLGRSRRSPSRTATFGRPHTMLTPWFLWGTVAAFRGARRRAACGGPWGDRARVERVRAPDRSAVRRSGPSPRWPTPRGRRARSARGVAGGVRVRARAPAVLGAQPARPPEPLRGRRRPPRTHRTPATPSCTTPSSGSRPAPTSSTCSRSRRSPESWRSCAAAACARRQCRSWWSSSRSCSSRSCPPRDGRRSSSRATCSRPCRSS